MFFRFSSNATTGSRIKQIAMGVLFSLTAALFSAPPTYAQHAGDIHIDTPWIRASVPGQTNGAGYLVIDHHGKQNDRLLAVQSDVAERIELHTVETENGMARMRKVDGIAVAAGKKTVLVPGGFHVMFLKLRAPFKAGETVSATLRFERAGDIAIRFTVQPATHRPEGQSGQAGKHGSHDKHHHGHHHH